MGIINTAEAGLRVSRGRIIEPVIQSEIVDAARLLGRPTAGSVRRGAGHELLASRPWIEPDRHECSPGTDCRCGARDPRPVADGVLGVGAQAVGLSASQVKDAKFEREVGLVILSIDGAGPAQQAGLLIGDILCQ